MGHSPQGQPVTKFGRILLVPAGMATIGLGAIAWAQIEGNDRGVPPIDSSANYEIGGVQVDVSAKTADQARAFGWRLAQRRGWKLLWGRVNNAPPEQAPNLSDGQLDQMVAGVSIEDEKIGPHRYIARLGVLFDRGRAAELLGIRAAGVRSVPMLVIPVMWSSGAPQSFERRTEWQKAWARFRSGGSPIDYVRPVGSGLDPLLLNIAQAGRPGRGQWRNLLEQYGAADIVVPIVKLERRWPGGPVAAVFEAYHGPDGQLLARFALRCDNSDAMPAMLDEGVRRLDEAYAAALRDGRLNADTSLAVEPEEVPALPEEAPIEASASPVALAGAASTAIVQVDTPDDAARAAVEGALRGVPGVRSVRVDSLALGGVSLMRVGFDGDPQAFRAALQAAGFTVEDTGGGLRLRRAAR